MTEPDGGRALVVGAGGFIGARLVRSLVARGTEVTCVVRPGSSSDRLADLQGEVEIVAADISEQRSIERVVERTRPDAVVNLAAPHGHPRTGRERAAHLEASVLGTAWLVEALAALGTGRLVHVGSSLEYGAYAAPLSEDDRPTPGTPRGAAKAAATIVALAWAGALSVPACVLRLFSVYGPGEAEQRFVPSALRAALEGTELPLTEPGLAHDFVYVDDVVRAITRALDSPDALDGRIVNVGTGRQTTNEDLVAAVERVVGCTVQTRPGAYPTAPHDSKTWVADVTLARELLGWQAQTPLENGLRLTLEWMRRATPVS